MVEININWPVLLVQIVTFIIGMFFIWKIFVKYFLNILADRAKSIKETIESTEKGKQEVERLKAEYEKNLKEIDKKIQEVVRTATKEGIEVKNEIIVKAREESKAILDKTYEKIEIEKEKMIKELKTQVVEMAISIAEKVIKESIDQKTQAKLVDKILSEIKNEKN